MRACGGQWGGLPCCVRTACTQWQSIPLSSLSHSTPLGLLQAGPREQNNRWWAAVGHAKHPNSPVSRAGRAARRARALSCLARTALQLGSRAALPGGGDRDGVVASVERPAPHTPFAAPLFFFLRARFSGALRIPAHSVVSGQGHTIGFAAGSRARRCGPSGPSCKRHDSYARPRGAPSLEKQGAGSATSTGAHAGSSGRVLCVRRRPPLVSAAKTGEPRQQRHCSARRSPELVPRRDFFTALPCACHACAARSTLDLRGGGGG